MRSAKLPREVHVVAGTAHRARNIGVALPDKIKARIPFAEWADNAEAFTREQFIRETSDYLHTVYGIGTEQDRHILMMLADQLQIYIDARREYQKHPLVVKINAGKTHAPNPYIAIANKAMDNCIRLMGELGLTPKSRLSADKVEEDSPYAELLKGYRRA
jgi:P27 family predicted phage terminase small subunit